MPGKEVGAGSPCAAVVAGLGDACCLQALEGVAGGGAGQPGAPHDALGGDVGGAVALVVAHLVVADAVVAAQRHGSEGDEAVSIGKDGQVGGLAAHSVQRSASRNKVTGAQAAAGRGRCGAGLIKNRAPGRRLGV